MTREKSVGVDNAAADEANTSRRKLAFAVLGALGGSALVEACAANGEGASGDSVGAIEQSLDGTTSIFWCDNYAELIAASGGTSSSSINVAVVRGDSAGNPYPGGGGLFVWSQTSKQHDGGTVVNSTNSSTVGWRRVFSGPLDVRWFGAAGDGDSGKATANTTAITNAFKAAALLTMQHATPDGGTSWAVEFPQGHYCIDDEIEMAQSMGSGLPVNGYMNVLSHSRAIIEQVNDAKKILKTTGNTAKNIRVSGLTFRGGTEQIHFENAGESSSSDVMLQIDHCEFHGASSYAVFAGVMAGTHIDGDVSIDNCRFYNCRSVLSTWCEGSVIQNSWINPKSQSSLVAPPDAVFKNNYGKMRILNTDCVDPLSSHPDAPNSEYYRWVANYGSFFATGVRFGGDNAGMPIVYHYSSPQTANTYTGDTVSIIGCDVWCDRDDLSDVAVIVLVDGIPQNIVFRDNNGPFGSPAGVPIVRVAPSGAVNTAGLSAYLATYSATRFHISADANYQGGSQRAFPPELMRFVVSPVPWSGFPAGAQLASWSSGTLSRYTFTIPQALRHGFMAFVTVSCCPNTAGDTQYRTTSTYLVAMTVGYDPGLSHQAYTLSSQSVFQVSDYYTAPAITAVAFPNGTSKQSTSSDPAEFTVTWDTQGSAAALGTAYSSITLQLLHASL